MVQKYWIICIKTQWECIGSHVEVSYLSIQLLCIAYYMYPFGMIFTQFIHEFYTNYYVNVFN